MRSIRPTVRCVLRRGEQILVAEAIEPVQGEPYYFPLGGGIEFGEGAADAVRREVMEELGAALADVCLLRVIEDIYTYENETFHEITFVFEARLADAALYQDDELRWTESDGTEWLARWLSLDHFAPGGPQLYPTGLYELLRKEAGRYV
jgi:ADP-ribose pyrophosphatase YjhB (NUDIX family)